jgi:DNA-binding NarL/FixJ family response regulator
MAGSGIRLPDDPTQVFLLIENRLVRETLMRLFRKRSDLSVVGQGGTADALNVLESHCDILVLDDLQILERLSAHQPREQGDFPFGVVLIGMEENEDQFLCAVRAGVSSFLLNDASANDVVVAVRATARSEAVCPPRLCLALFRAMAKLSHEAPAHVPRWPLPGLTIRQQQLIALVAKGLTNKEIALQLNLSEFTVKNHMHRIMKQVDADSRYEAVQVARASGYSAII